MTIINTNARSLCPKVQSLIECIEETDTKIAIVTETWLRDGNDCDALRDELSLGNGLGLIAKNRQVGGNGVAYGGVALVWKESFAGFKEVSLPNPQRNEVLVAAGSMRGHSRKIVVVACYVPPNLQRRRAAEVLGYIGMLS